jgi:hypothetical protein
VPPGRAPDHFHRYDEVLYVLEGEGVASTVGRRRSGAGRRCTCRRASCDLENTGDVELRLLGVFRPAGSPAEAYYPDGTPAATPRPRDDARGGPPSCLTVSPAAAAALTRGADMPRIERTAETSGREPARGEDRSRRRPAPLPRSVLERDPDRRARARRARGLLAAAHDCLRTRSRPSCPSRASAAACRSTARSSWTRSRARASDRRLAAHGRRLGRRARQRDIRRGGRGADRGCPFSAPCAVPAPR